MSQLGQSSNFRRKNTIQGASGLDPMMEGRRPWLDKVECCSFLRVDLAWLEVSTKQGISSCTTLTKLLLCLC